MNREDLEPLLIFLICLAIVITVIAFPIYCHFNP